MAFYIDSVDKMGIFSAAENLAGKDKDDALESTLFAAVVAEVSAYTNQDFEFLEAPADFRELSTDKDNFLYAFDEYDGMTEQKTTCPRQIIDGVFVPMLAARMAAGMQSVSSVSEGGSSASFTNTYSANVADYAAILCRYKRMGYPRKVGAV